MNDTATSMNTAPVRVIESASASTACQTNNSKFAYALTAGVLGVIALLAIAGTLLLFAAFATMSSSNDGYSTNEDYYRYHDWDDDDYGWSGYGDEFSELQAL